MASVTRRRIVAAAGALIAVTLARAQGNSRIPVVGLLDGGQREEWWSDFRGQLKELGYIEGQNVAFESRYANGDVEKIRPMARELVRLNAAVIVTSGSAAALAAKRATSTIPVVTATGADQVTLGLAVSFARPGRNVTGVSSLAPDLTRKRLEVLRQVIPHMSRLSVLWHSDNIGSSAVIREIEIYAESSKIALQNLGIQAADELAGAFSAAKQAAATAVFVVASPYLFSLRTKIAEFALKNRLPTMNGPSEYVDAGGLLSYGPSYPDLFRRAAFYVDKILKGAKPADLPIEQPTRFDLVINLKTAKALGLAIPQSILMRADRVVD